LAAAIAGVRYEPGEGDGSVATQGFGAFADLESDFPVAGVVAEGDRAAVVVPEAAEGAED